MAASKAFIKSVKLIQEAEQLITPNAFDNNGGISSIASKSETVLKNNKLGFSKLQKAARLNIHWQTHFNLGEFYFSGLDGATSVNKFKSAQHYISALQVAHKSMCKTFAPQYEGMLLNLCGVLENLDLLNKDIDTNQIIKLSKYLCKHSQFIQFKIFGHYIRALILNRLSKRAESYIQYQKCIEFKQKQPKLSYYSNFVMIKAEEMMQTMKITNEALNEQMVNKQHIAYGSTKYKKNFDHFQAQKNRLHAQNKETARNLSNVNNERLETVGVIRTKDKDNNDGLMTIDARLSAVTVETGNAAERKCNCCGKLAFDMKRCGKCKKVYYCDVKCQKKDWKQHKKTCKRFKE